MNSRRPGPRRAGAVLLTLLLHASLAAAEDPDRTLQRPRYVGLSLPGALDRLQAEGLRLLYSSELVRPDMRVEGEPHSLWPRQILDELLAPHGLESRPGPGGVLMIVKAPARGRIRGWVLDGGSAAPLAGVQVVVMESGASARTGDDGGFALPDLPVGRYSIRAEVSHYFAGELHDVPVKDRQATEVRIDLVHVMAAREEVQVTAEDPAHRRRELFRSELVDRQRLERSPRIADDPLRSAGALAGTAASDESAALNVRGGSDDEVMIVLDGMELYQPFHLKDRQGLASIIDYDAVDALELHSGGFPADYGGRMSGVIELTSLEPAGEGRTTLEAQDDLIRMAGHGSLLEGRGSWLVSARRGRPRRLLENLDVDPQYQPVYYDLLGKARYRLDDETSLTLHVLGAHDAIEGKNGNLIVSSDSLESFRSLSRDAYVWLTLRQVRTPRFYTESTLSLGDLSFQRAGTLANGAQEILDDRQTLLLGLKHAGSWMQPRHALRWGAEVKFLETDYHYELTSDAGFPGADRRLVEEPSGVESGLFVADRVVITDALRAEVGLRWDRQSITGDSQVSPRANVIRDLGERSALRVGWGLFHQPQRINELRIEDGETEFHDAQRAEHRVIGLRHAWQGGTELGLSIYQKLMAHLQPRYENLFDPFGYFPEAQDDRVRIDARRAEARGLEVTLRGPKGRRWSWWADYTLASVEDDVDGIDVPRSWDQRHTLHGGVHVRWTEAWGLALSGTFHSGRPTTDLTAGGERNGSRLPSYYRLDLRVSRSLLLKRSRLQGFVDVTNVLDTRNVCCVERFDEIADSEGNTTLRRHDRNSVRRTLSFGILWSF